MRATALLMTALLMTAQEMAQGSVELLSVCWSVPPPLPLPQSKPQAPDPAVASLWSPAVHGVWQLIRPVSQLDKTRWVPLNGESQACC